MVRLLIISGLIFGGIWYFYHLDSKKDAPAKTNIEATKEDSSENKDGGKTTSDSKKTSADELENTGEAVKNISKATGTEISPTEEPKRVFQNSNYQPTTIKAAVVNTNMKTVNNITLKATVPNTYAKVFLYEWGIDVKTNDGFRAGTADFKIKNLGRFSHGFAIDGVKDFGKVKPGETIYGNANLKIGEYRLYSSHKNDADKFMTETVTVR